MGGYLLHQRMPDWGVASGPTDTETHAEKLMKTVIRKGLDPDGLCPDCGSPFHVAAEESPVNALDTYRCPSCGQHTYDWNDTLDDAHIDADYTF